MASIEDLGRALIRADAAGDFEGARTLAAELSRMRGATPTEPPPGVVIHGGDGVDRVAGRPELFTQRSGDAETDTGRAAVLSRRASGTDMGADARAMMPVMQGVSGGWGDEAVSRLNQMRGGDYAASQEIQRQELERQRAEHPRLSAAGELAGGLLLGLGAGGAGATLMRPGMSLPALVGAGGVEGAGYGAIYGAGEADAGKRAQGAGKGALVGGVVGGSVPVFARTLGALVGRGVTPTSITPERQAMVDILRNEGVPVTAGQRSGSKALQYAESFLGDAPGAGGQATKAMQDQAEAFTNAAMQRAGASGRATPENLSNAYDRLGKQFSDLSARNTMKADQQLGNDLGSVLKEYDKVLPSEQRAIVGNMVSDIVDRLKAGQGSLPGADYQTIRSRLSRMAQNARQSDPEFSSAIRGLRDAVDSNMGRSVSPADQAAWQETRRQYGNYKTLERAAAGAGANTAEGLVSPQALRTAVASGPNRGAYARGEGDFADLVRAGNAVMAPLPNSGTAQRNILASMAASLGGAGTAAAMGSPGAAALAAGAVGAPALAGRAIMSGPMQAYLSNEAISPVLRAMIEQKIRAGLMGAAQAEAPQFLPAR